MNLTSVPIGATVADAYYCVPEHYSAGLERWPVTSEGFEAACRAANAKADKVRAQVVESYARTIVGGIKSVEEIAEDTAKVGAVVDLRWKIDYPPPSYAGGGASGLETTVERMNVRHLDDAHWERVAKSRAEIGEVATMETDCVSCNERIRVGHRIRKSEGFTIHRDCT
jgi:hypothetical protein